jgi:hypothetical protein
LPADWRGCPVAGSYAYPEPVSDLPLAALLLQKKHQLRLIFAKNVVLNVPFIGFFLRFGRPNQTAQAINAILIHMTTGFSTPIT